ncbi:MAG TPA: hypothetical protein VGM88_32295 [Kofleriaceae bacterium]
MPYFAGAELTFVFDGIDGDDRLDEIAAAVRRFLALSTRDRDAAAPAVFENYRAAHAADVEIAGPADVWRHVHPDEIRVTRHRAVYVQITAECDWEPEHGIQLIYREGWELTRVSEQDGHLE